MPNYSANATKPDQNNVQPDPNKPQSPYVIPPTQPKSIRDYLQLARSQGWGTDPNAPVPRFTNIPGGAGMQVGEPAKMGIPEKQVSEYEKVPFSKRVGMDPYLRARERVKDLLPVIWEQLFPGVQPGSGLDENQLKNWNQAVQHVTNSLIKQYEKQYEWNLKKREKSQKNRDDQVNFFFSKFIDAKLKGQLPVREDGTTQSAKEFIDENMSVWDQMQMERDMSEEGSKQDALGDYTAAAGGNVPYPESIESPKVKKPASDAMAKEPEAVDQKTKLRAAVVKEFGRRLGRPDMDIDKFMEYYKNPAYTNTINQIIKDLSGESGAIPVK